MSKAEERALEAYPPLYGKYDRNGYDYAEDDRKVYIQGYEQAEKDFMEKADRWLFKSGLFNSAKLREYWRKDFKQFMTEK